MRLYRLTQNERYLKLAQYFLTGAGTECEGMNTIHLPLTYYQAHLPVLKQDTAEGHAVRLVYLCTAMADACWRDRR